MPKLAKMFNETIEQIDKITNIYSDIGYFSYNITLYHYWYDIIDYIVPNVV